MFSEIDSQICLDFVYPTYLNWPLNCIVSTTWNWLRSHKTLSGSGRACTERFQKIMRDPVRERKLGNVRERYKWQYQGHYRRVVRYLLISSIQATIFSLRWTVLSFFLVEFYTYMPIQIHDADTGMFQGFSPPFKQKDESLWRAHPNSSRRILFKTIRYIEYPGCERS